mgnify:CR=1 FL=1
MLTYFFSSNCFSHYRVRHRNNYSQKSAPLAAPFFCLNKNLLKKMIYSPISRVFRLLSFSSFFFLLVFLIPLVFWLFNHKHHISANLTLRNKSFPRFPRAFSSVCVYFAAVLQSPITTLDDKLSIFLLMSKPLTYAILFQDIVHKLIVSLNPVQLRGVLI